MRRREGGLSKGKKFRSSAYHWSLRKLTKGIRFLSALRLYSEVASSVEGSCCCCSVPARCYQHPRTLQSLAHRWFHAPASTSLLEFLKRCGLWLKICETMAYRRL